MRPLLLLALLSVLMGADAGKERKPEVIKKYRLELEPDDTSGLFFTAWAEGDVISASDGSDGKLVYRRRFKWGDGCEWVATEVLKPIAPRKLEYTYRETPTSCPSGAKPSINSTTPRDGVVIVHPLDKDKPLTSLDAWAAGGYGI